jgi:hypothetical protein
MGIKFDKKENYWGWKCKTILKNDLKQTNTNKKNGD